MKDEYAASVALGLILLTLVVFAVQPAPKLEKTESTTTTTTGMGLVYNAYPKYCQTWQGSQYCQRQGPDCAPHYRVWKENCISESLLLSGNSTTSRSGSTQYTVSQVRYNATRDETTVVTVQGIDGLCGVSGNSFTAKGVQTYQSLKISNIISVDYTNVRIFSSWSFANGTVLSNQEKSCRGMINSITTLGNVQIMTTTQTKSCDKYGNCT